MHGLALVDKIFRYRIIVVPPQCGGIVANVTISGISTGRVGDAFVANLLDRH